MAKTLLYIYNSHSANCVHIVCLRYMLYKEYYMSFFYVNSMHIHMQALHNNTHAANKTFNINDCTMHEIYNECWNHFYHLIFIKESIIKSILSLKKNFPL